MRLPFLNSLRNQVLFLLGLSLLPLGILTFYLSIEEGAQAEADARDDARATVQEARNTIGSALEATKDLLAALGKNPALQNSNKFCFDLITAIRPAYPHLFGIGVSDEQGFRLCSSETRKPFEKVTTGGDHDLVVDRVKATRAPVVAAMDRTVNGRPSLAVVGPVFREDGTVSEFVAASIDVSWLEQRIAVMAIADEASLVVFDRDGKLIGRNPKSLNLRPGEKVPAFELSLAQLPEREGQRMGPDGVGQFFQSAAVNGADGISVVFRIPSSIIYRDSRRKLSLHLAALVLVSIVIFGVVWFGSNRFVARPLENLNLAARRIGRGDASARSGLKYEGEIGALARSFDEMADLLQSARQRNDEAAAAFRSILEGTSNATGEAFFQSLVLSLTSALRADYALVGEFLPGGQAVQTLAVCYRGELQNAFVYELAGTPCEYVRNKVALCYYRSDVQNLFPLDGMLQEYDMDSYLGTPLLDDHGAPVGIVVVLHKGPLQESVIEADSMLSIFAARASAEMKRLHVERDLLATVEERDEAARRNESMVGVLRDLTARLQVVREEERTKISREIHDELGQQLTIMRFDTAAIRKQVKELPQEESESLLKRVESLRSALDVAIQDVRRISGELRPGVLDTFGPVAAIQWLADQFEKRTGIVCRVNSPEELSAPKEIATTLFRICQESLTNVARHSRATLVEIDIKVKKTGIAIEISDNGVGVPGGVLVSTHSLGVLGMQERARMVNGVLEIGNGRLGGVTVSAILPAGARGAAAG